MPDQYLGPYLLQDKLGSGGMGSVYRARHAKTGQPVAVKLIAEQVADSERFRRRFSVEVETLKKLNHPNIVRLIGYGEEQGRLFYSMDIVEGPSLQQHLRKEKRLDWHVVLQIGIDICSALKHAHDLGVIHRDLKPANLLMAPDGSIQLVDFGIAKMFGAGDYTAVGSVLGTADYMAPEQAGDGKITNRTDLYALGSVMYACLAGRPPFNGKSITTVIEALRRDPPVPLDLIVPETPEELTELIHQLLSKDPQDRPPTALVVGNRLRAMRAGLEAREVQTHMDTAGQTQIEDPTDNEELDVDDEYLIKDDVSPVAGTHDQPTIDATMHSGGSAPQRNPTLKSRGGTNGNDNDGFEISSGLSQFQTVAEAERRQRTLSGTESHPAAHWLSIAGLVLLLCGLIAGGLYLIRPPTADDLYSAIAAADATGNVAESKTEIQSFLRLHGDDPRADQVRQIADAMDVESTVRKLRLRALRSGGIQHLDPPQQAFLAAALLREQDPGAARQQLQHWLTVYGHKDLPTSTEVKRLAILARSEVEALGNQHQTNNDQRAEELAELLTWANDNLPPEEQKRFYTGIIALYEDQSWASEQVKSAEAALGKQEGLDPQILVPAP
ncbi:Serine/threonine-protein kinase PknL [Roseimaritima multifibrata]|uniref:Serine/threonine-protein kinase PknL n=1 Tax=Roseimaritima multifibrata TaxID=1930274 RepID=A0A517MPA8_9BACT|nr:serine/threonine-protein kinase [Roseimaritima multifibrata]QDS96712.1 Serine/threonine-protein kinase PknL [Roseimaritima multifibrata]